MHQPQYAIAVHQTRQPRVGQAQKLKPDPLSTNRSGGLGVDSREVLERAVPDLDDYCRLDRIAVLVERDRAGDAAEGGRPDGVTQCCSVSGSCFLQRFKEQAGRVIRQDSRGVGQVAVKLLIRRHEILY